MRADPDLVSIEVEESGQSVKVYVAYNGEQINKYITSGFSKTSAEHLLNHICQEELEYSDYHELISAKGKTTQELRREIESTKNDFRSTADMIKRKIREINQNKDKVKRVVSEHQYDPDLVFNRAKKENPEPEFMSDFPVFIFTAGAISGAVIVFVLFYTTFIAAGM